MAPPRLRWVVTMVLVCVQGVKFRTKHRPYRQALENHDDLQYLSEITIGGQKVRAVPDTGSMEFAVLSDKCTIQCGRVSSLYHPDASTTYIKGTLSVMLTYGSGQIMGKEAYDTVSIGSLVAEKAAFWEINDAYMPLLLKSDFQAILGLGPVPPDTTFMKQSAPDNSQSYAVLQGVLGISQFGVCIGRAQSSPGYFIWNDDSVELNPQYFTKLAVFDNGFWMTRLENVRLGNVPIACQSGGCGAILDSGTSLLGMPTDAFKSLKSAIGAVSDDCLDTLRLPDLKFRLDGHDFSLPADAYLAHVSGEPSKNAPSYAKLPGVGCQASLIEINLNTTRGLAWILGVPFFRHYYSVFVQGTEREPPAMYTAATNTGCYPANPEVAGVWSQHMGVTQIARNIDASKVFLPPWLRKAGADGRLRELQAVTDTSKTGASEFDILKAQAAGQWGASASVPKAPETPVPARPPRCIFSDDDSAAVEFRRYGQV